MKQPMQPPVLRPRRIGVAEAKSRLSELLRQAAGGPTIIHSRGRDLAVVLAVEEYDRLTAEHRAARGGGAAFLARVDALKERYGGGVEAFAPERLQLKPMNPFARTRRKRP
jgi:prevent-host-death family protein